MIKTMLLLLITLLSGCAYNQQTISAYSGSTVYATGTVDKPVSIDTLRDLGKGSTNTIPASVVGLP